MRVGKNFTNFSSKPDLFLYECGETSVILVFQFEVRIRRLLIFNQCEINRKFFVGSWNFSVRFSILIKAKCSVFLLIFHVVTI